MARGVHGRSAALVGLPQPRSVSGQERAGCWGRVVRDGDRPRPRHGRRGQGLAGGADPAEHHAAVASRWPAGRSGLPPAISRPVRIADAISRAARRKNLGDLREFGLPIPEEGVFSRVKRLDQVPSLVDMDVIDAIRDGSIEVVSTVESFDGGKVVLVDGSRLEAYAVILATGYLRGLEPLVGHLGVLDAKGKPVSWRVRPAAEGLRFIGYDVRPSLIGYMAKQSKRMARRIVRELSAGLDTPTPARHRAPASDTRRASCARPCRRACSAADS